MKHVPGYETPFLEHFPVSSRWNSKLLPLWRWDNLLCPQIWLARKCIMSSCIDWGHVWWPKVTSYIESTPLSSQVDKLTCQTTKLCTQIAPAYNVRSPLGPVRPNSPTPLSWISGTHGDGGTRDGRRAHHAVTVEDFFFPLIARVVAVMFVLGHKPMSSRIPSINSGHPRNEWMDKSGHHRELQLPVVCVNWMNGLHFIGKQVPLM